MHVIFTLLSLCFLLVSSLPSPQDIIDPSVGATHTQECEMSGNRFVRFVWSSEHPMGIWRASTFSQFLTGTSNEVSRQEIRSASDDNTPLLQGRFIYNPKKKKRTAKLVFELYQLMYIQQEDQLTYGSVREVVQCINWKYIPIFAPDSGRVPGAEMQIYKVQIGTAAIATGKFERIGEPDQGELEDEEIA